MSFSVFNNMGIQIPLWVKAGDTQNNKKLNKARNDAVFLNVFNELVEYAVKRYKIEGLPENCNERVVLMSLLWYANVVFWDNGNGILALPGTPGDQLTLYGDPGRSFIYGCNGFNKQVKLYIPNGENNGVVRKSVGGITLPKTYEAVMVRESMTAYPFINQVFFYADAMADTLRTLDNVRLNLKQPYMIAADDKLKPSIEKMFKDRNSNTNLIIGTGDLSDPSKKITLLPFEANPQALRDCTMTYEWYMNQFLNKCGINIATIVDKKAQVTDDEIHANDSVSDTNTSNTLDYLNSQLENVNKAFGLNMRAVPANQELEAQSQDSEDNDFDGGNSDDGIKD